jgi:hypothetical protein
MLIRYEIFLTDPIVDAIDAMVLSGCRICDNLTDEKENN